MLRATASISLACALLASACARDPEPEICPAAGPGDLVISETLKAAYVFPAKGHDPIVYPAALTASADPAALAFLDFLSGADGQAILARFGFSSAGP